MSTSALKPLPTIYEAVDGQRKHTQLWREYFAAVDALLRTSLSVQLATPNNANAKAAGVPLGGLYTSTSDPAILYIRTA